MCLPPQTHGGPFLGQEVRYVLTPPLRSRQTFPTQPYTRTWLRHSPGERTEPPLLPRTRALAGPEHPGTSPMHLHGFTRTKHSLLSATILPSSLELKALAGQILAWLPIYHLSENNSLLKQMEKFKERKAKGNPTELQHLQIKALGVLTARNAHTTTGETEQIRGVRETGKNFTQTL